MRYGTLHWEQEDAPTQSFTRSSKYVVFHPSWNGNFKESVELALVRIQNPIVYYEQAGDNNRREVGVGPICVPKRGDRYSGMVTVAGWGASE